MAANRLSDAKQFHGTILIFPDSNPIKNPKARYKPWGSSISVYKHEPYGLLLSGSNNPRNNNSRRWFMNRSSKMQTK